jgi:hypothetical protein
MISGPALTLSSPWLVISFGPLHKKVFEEYFAFLTGGQCTRFENLMVSAYIEWISGLVILGIIAMFIGLWLFRSTRFHRINFRRNYAA